MKLSWSPERALNAYIDSVKSSGNSKESGVTELLSAMAAGWNAKLIVESWSRGGPIATSIGLAVAARHTSGRHVCVVLDEVSRSDYVKLMHGAGMENVEVMVGEAEVVMAALPGVDFLVADCKRRDLVRVLRFARLGHNGAILACKNARLRPLISGFPWLGVLGRRTRVVRSVFLPVGQGLHIAHAGGAGGGPGLKTSPSRWIRHVDQNSGEEHVFRV